MLVVDLLAWNALAELSSKDRWYGETIPDIGFLQLGVREVSNANAREREVLR